MLRVIQWLECPLMAGRLDEVPSEDDGMTFDSQSVAALLGAEERRFSERALAEAQDCVIVATSTLELGIDVGYLDRVLQIDAPWSVASFLQRLGRTGRRPGTVRNRLFLATNEEALLRAGVLLALWEAGFVEPIVPRSGRSTCLRGSKWRSPCRKGGSTSEIGRAGSAGCRASQRGNRDARSHCRAPHRDGSSLLGWHSHQYGRCR